MPLTNDCIPLSEMTAGEEATIIDFKGGRAVNNRLASLGFTPGVQVCMTQNFGHGPLIVTVRGTRVALGRGEALRILVARG
jgi:ferrous iron transport protein A